MGEFLMLWLSKQKNFEDKHGLCFSEVPAASTAVRQMQSFLFYDKPMRIQYEKTKSDCLAKADGTFVPREKKERQEEKAAEKRRKAEEGHGLAANGSNAQSKGGPSATQASHGQSKSGQREETAPNSILFIQNLPHETTSIMLQILFQQYPGFKEVRMIEVKPGIAFVEFEDDMQASIAMQALQGFKITPQNPMAIAYAKK